MTYWNTASFFSLYASHSSWAPQTARPVAERAILDQWILAEVHALAAAVDQRMEAYNTARAGRCWPTLSTTCRTGKCGGPGSGSGRVNRTRSQLSTSASTFLPACWRRSCRSSPRKCGSK